MLADGKFEEPMPTHAGYRYFDQGRTAVLEMENDVTVVLHSKRVGNTSLNQFRSLGIEPARKKIIILKGVNAPKGAYSQICSTFVLANTPGPTAADLRQFNYCRRRTPLFPLEPVGAWRPL
jgi:microcystin degradation protein MlrC